MSSYFWLNLEVLDVNMLLDKTESHEDHFTRLQKSTSAASIALPGMILFFYANFFCYLLIPLSN